MSEQAVGFIGLGNMGGRMTAVLVRAGVEVLGYDTNHGVVAAAGATVADSVAEVAERCDVVMLSLPDSHVVEAVVLGEQGLLAHARQGHVIDRPRDRRARVDARSPPAPGGARRVVLGRRYLGWRGGGGQGRVDVDGRR